MAAREIVLDATDPHFTVQAQLDGSSYTFEFEWLDAVGAWFLSLLGPKGDAVLSGLKVVLDWPLTGRHRTRDVPAGTLLFMAETGAAGPGRYELGERVKLYYLDAAGVDA